MMRHLRFALVLLMVIGCATRTVERPPDFLPDAASLRSALHRAPDSTFRVLAYSDTLWEALLDSISANQDYLALAPALKRRADAHPSETLDIALAYALPRNPVGVLALLDSAGPFRLEAVCSAPFIEPDDTTVVRYTAEAESALRRVSVPELLRRRDACMKALRSEPDTSP